MKAYEEARKLLLIKKSACLHTLLKTKLYHRMDDSRDKILYITSKQKLTPKEKKLFVVKYCNCNLENFYQELSSYAI